jgi:hypothetical protein
MWHTYDERDSDEFLSARSFKPAEREFNYYALMLHLMEQNQEQNSSKRTEIMHRKRVVYESILL